MSSGTVVMVLAMVIEVIDHCTEQYEQLPLKCPEASQWMQSFFLQHCLIASSETQLAYNCFQILALAAATLVSSHSIWSEN